MNIIDKREQEIRDAWELFVKQGKLKRDNLRNEVVFAWERSKLYGVDPLLEKLDLNSNNESNLKANKQNDITFAFNKIILDDLEKIKSKLYLIDKEGEILANIDGDNDIFGLDCGKVLEESVSANLSYYLALKKQRADYIFGAEHYLQMFHHCLDITLLTDINDETYYLLFIVDKKDVDDIVSYAQTLENLESKWLTVSAYKGDKDSRDSFGDAPDGVANRAENNATIKADSKAINSTVNETMEMLTATDKAMDNSDNQDDYLTEIDLLQSKKYNLVANADDKIDNNYQSFLFVGNREDVIHKKIFKLLKQSSSNTKIITINFLFLKSYNLQFDIEPWYQRLKDCVIIFDHLEKLKPYDSDQLLAEIKIANSFLEERKIKIIAINYQDRALPRNFKKKLNRSFAQIEYYYAKLEMDRKHSTTSAINKSVSSASDKTIDTAQTKTSTQIISKTKKWNNKEKDEINTIKRAIKTADNNMTEVAKQLGISRSTLYRRIKKYQIAIER